MSPQTAQPTRGRPSPESPAPEPADPAQLRFREKEAELEDAYNAAADAAKKVTAALRFREVDTRNLKRQLQRTTAGGHSLVDALAEAAPDAFYRAVCESSWLGHFARGESMVPAPEIVGWHELIADGKTLAERLHETIERIAADPRVNAFTDEEPDELEARIAANEKERAALEPKIEKAEAERREAATALTNWRLGR